MDVVIELRRLFPAFEALVHVAVDLAEVIIHVALEVVFVRFRQAHLRALLLVHLVEAAGRKWVFLTVVLLLLEVGVGVDSVWRSLGPEVEVRVLLGVRARLLGVPALVHLPVPPVLVFELLVLLLEGVQLVEDHVHRARSHVLVVVGCDADDLPRLQRFNRLVDLHVGFELGFNRVVRSAFEGKASAVVSAALVAYSRGVLVGHVGVVRRDCRPFLADAALVHCVFLAPLGYPHEVPEVIVC